MKLSNSFYEIEITEDPTYRLFSTDNKLYNFVVIMDEYTRSSHYKALSIQVIDLNTYNAKSIAAIGGIYSFSTENCAILNGTILAVLIQDIVALIELQSMSLLSKNKVVDMGTAFAIYPFCDNYIIHGELEVVLINPMGEKLWSFSGRDIFALPNDKSHLDVFQIEGEIVIFYDWDGNKYVLNKDGKEISSGYLRR